MKSIIAKIMSALLVALIIVSAGIVITADDAAELTVEVVLQQDSVSEDGTLNAQIYMYPGKGAIKVATLNFSLEYDREVLTLTSFTTDLSDGALAYLPTSSYAFCYDEYAGIDAIDVKGRTLVAEAIFKVADVKKDINVTVGFDGTSNYTKYNDPDDPIYIGYTPDVISDTVTVKNDDRYYQLIGDINGDSLVNGVDHAIFLRHLAKWSGYEDIDNSMMDVNDDGAINIDDAVYLARLNAEWDGYTLPDGYYVEPK